jgi:hypothetical protein
MSRSPNFPSTQIGRVMISGDTSGLLVAPSADLSGRAAFATDIPSLTRHFETWSRVCSSSHDLENCLKQEGYSLESVEGFALQAATINHPASKW